MPSYHHRYSHTQEKIERAHVFTVSNYYLCDNINDEKGTFDIIAALPIRGNEDYIDRIRRNDTRMVFIPTEVSESITDIAKEVRRRGGRVSRNFPSAKGQSGKNGGLHSVSVRQSSKQGGNPSETDRAGESESAVGAGRNANSIAADNEWKGEHPTDPIGTDGDIYTIARKAKEARYIIKPPMMLPVVFITIRGGWSKEV